MFAMVDGGGLEQTVRKKYVSTTATITDCAGTARASAVGHGRVNFVTRQHASQSARMVLVTRASVSVRRIGGGTLAIAGDVSTVRGRITRLRLMLHFRDANAISDGADLLATPPSTACLALVPTVGTAPVMRIAFAQTVLLARIANRSSAQTSAAAMARATRLSLGATVQQGLTGLSVR